MSKITYVTINPDKRKGGVGKNGIIDSPTLPRDNDRRRGGLEAPVTIAWTHEGVGQGGEIRIELPNRDGAPIDQNRDAYFKTGDLLLLHVQTYNAIARPSGWEDVPNGQFIVAGMKHYYWWRRVTGTESGVWVISNDDIFDLWTIYGIRGAVATGDPFYSTQKKSYPPTLTEVDIKTKKRGDLFFAFGFPDTFGPYPLNVPEFSVVAEDYPFSKYQEFIKLGNNDDNPATTEAQLQNLAAINNPSSSRYGKLLVGGSSDFVTVSTSGQVFSGFVKWEKKKAVLETTGSYEPFGFYPIKGDLIVGVWFNDGTNTDLGSEGTGFWERYFTELNVSIPALDGVSVHVGYRRYKADNQAEEQEFLGAPINAVILRNASEKLELIGTGGGSDLIILSGGVVKPEEFVILFTAFADPHFFLEGGFRSTDLKDVSASVAAIDYSGFTTDTKFGETGSRIYASTAYGKGTTFSASYAQVRSGPGEVEPARTFAIKVRRK